MKSAIACMLVAYSMAMKASKDHPCHIEPTEHHELITRPIE